MKTSTKQARSFRPTISKIVMAFAVTSVMGGMVITPALGENNDGRAGAAQDRGRNDDRNQNENRNRNDRRDQRAHRPASQHPYNYSQPVYAPPPVYYDPQPSPGINLVFPLNIRF